MNAPSPNPGMFAEPPVEGGLSSKTLAIAAVAVLILAAVLVLMARRPAAPAANNAAYAAQIELRDVQMSEADSQSGGKLIYLDGRVVNHGAAAVTALRVQVAFPNDLGQPAQTETVPVNLIYMREPYIDTRPVAAAPLAPGAAADFRLIFDDIKDSWNQQEPHFKVVQVATK
jgi:hypothetical protein